MEKKAPHKKDDQREGPLGDVRPEHGDDPRTQGGMDQEPVSRRPMVGEVRPSDYPETDRAGQAELGQEAIKKPKAEKGKEK